MGRSDVAIIIPAYNEESSIGRVVFEASAYGTVIVANDASNDRTREVAEENGAVVVSHDTNCGYDEALNTGFKAAQQRGFTYAVTMDADGQHNATLLAKYIELLTTSVDMVVGVRLKPARFGEFLFSKYANMFYGIKDPLCGMKGYHMKIYNNLGHFDSYHSIGTELAFYTAKKGYSFSHVTIPIVDRTGKSKFGGFWRGNGKILRSIYQAIRRR